MQYFVTNLNVLLYACLGIYFAVIMLLCSLSVVFTVFVLNLHHRDPTLHPMPHWVSTCLAFK